MVFRCFSAENGTSTVVFIEMIFYARLLFSVIVREWSLLEFDAPNLSLIYEILFLIAINHRDFLIVMIM